MHVWQLANSPLCLTKKVKLLQLHFQGCLKPKAILNVSRGSLQGIDSSVTGFLIYNSIPMVFYFNYTMEI